MMSPPHCKDSEMMVLGCMLSDRFALSSAVSALDLDDFYFHEHQIIFQALKNIFYKKKPGDIHLVAQELKMTSQLQTAGGIAYLTDLAQFAGTSAHVHEYIQLLKAKTYSRKAYFILEEGRQEFLSDPLDPSVLAEKYHQKLIHLGKKYASSDKASMGEILSGSKSRVDPIPLIERIEGRQQYYKRIGKPFMTGIPTGFVELDKETTILEETNFIVVAARPAMGKTALAINIANHVCIEQNKSVAFFSLEMGADQLGERFLSLRTGIAGEKIKRGMLSDEDVQLLKKEEEILRTAKMFVCDQNCTTIAQVVTKARQLKEEEDVSLYIIDYLQLMQGAGRAESRQYEVAEISRKLKLLAMEMKTPIVCIAQLSRKVEERQGHRPMMSDLRDSGQIEQDSDVVLFIQRQAYYSSFKQKAELEKAEIIVAKNRNGGATPSLFLGFDGACGKFTNPTKEMHEHRTKEMLYPERATSREITHPLLK
ncbi:MAG: replicative DNA helicase [Chlamydiales bacterium]|nr:replicative DNA helicase [Chlamydiales bacterium]